MKIEYLKKYEENLDNLVIISPPRGFSLSQIKELELQINNGNKFPKSLREYLFLCGDYDGTGVSDPQNMLDGTAQYLVMNESYQNDLKKAGLTLDRPIFIFHSYDGDVFSFIYLDEGDDPCPHHFGIASNMRGKNGELIYDFPQKTFSELVNVKVDRALKGLTPS
jgi:hypothetical protein